MILVITWYSPLAALEGKCSGSMPFLIQTGSSGGRHRLISLLARFKNGFCFEPASAIKNAPNTGFTVLTFRNNSGKSKNSSPEGPALTLPRWGGFGRQTTHGIMECWKNGILGIKSGCESVFIFCSVPSI
jgi:hypothetical protein